MRGHSKHSGGPCLHQAHPWLHQWESGGKFKLSGYNPQQPMHKENGFSVHDSKPEGLSFLYSLILLPTDTVFDDTT